MVPSGINKRAPSRNDDGDAPLTALPRLIIFAPSAELYGSDRALLSALPELLGSFDVTITAPESGPALILAKAHGAEAVVLPDHALRRRHFSLRALPGWLWRYWVALLVVVRLHRRQPFALLYSSTLATGIAAPLRFFWKVPHVVHMHECPLEPRWLPRVLLRITRRTSDLVVCNSHHTRSLLLRYEPTLEGQSIVIHNGLDLPTPDPQAQMNALGALRICLVGRITPKKGHAVLLEAARLASDRGIDWELHFYGDALPEQAPLERKLRQQIRDIGLQRKVFWHGFVQDTAEMYRDIDVCVVPSVLPEEFSLVCLEAQSMRLPVVATGPGGPSEIILESETGLIVPPGDPQALFEAIEKLRQDPELRARMGDLGRRRALANFSRRAYASQVLAACQSVMGDSVIGSDPPPDSPTYPGGST